MARGEGLNNALPNPEIYEGDWRDWATELIRKLSLDAELGVGSFLDLEDTEDTYLSAQNKVPVVGTSSPLGLEWEYRLAAVAGAATTIAQTSSLVVTGAGAPTVAATGNGAKLTFAAVVNTVSDGATSLSPASEIAYSGFLAPSITASGTKANVVFPNYTQFALLREVQTAGTHSHGGQTCSAGVNYTRELNEETFDPAGIVSLASNQFTLGPGVFLILWSTPGNRVNEFQSWLHRVTATSGVEIWGTSEYSDLETDQESEDVRTQTRSFGIGYLNLTASAAYEIRFEGSISVAQGFGNAANTATSADEVYTMVLIVKIGEN